jgi:hypothetical protein
MPLQFPFRCRFVGKYVEPQLTARTMSALNLGQDMAPLLVDFSTEKV